MKHLAKLLALAGAYVLAGCQSRPPGTCEKDSHCEGIQICFENKCMSLKERDAILEQRQQAAKPKVCQDKDGDGVRAGNGCPPGERLDCNDDSAQMAPGREEICDELDNDCDGMINEGLRGCVQTLFGGATWGNQEKYRLEAPRGIVFDPAGFVVVSDNHHLWKVFLDGRVELLAGSVVSHAQDGFGEEARFSYPAGLARAADGTIFVADCKNNCVRKVSPAGQVSTVAGLCSTLTKHTGQRADGPASEARFYCPSDLALAADGSLIVVDRENALIRRIGGDGQVTTLAGMGPVEVEEGEGQIGFQDGPAAEARFNDPQGVLIDSKGLVVSESFNCRLRRLVEVPGKGWMVSTLAGTSDTKLGVGGHQDGPAAAAKFSYPHGIVLDAQGNLLVADTGNAVIRMLTPNGVVKTVYGKPGESRALDGPLAQARFRTPTDLALGPEGSLFVVDTDANRVRWIVP